MSALAIRERDACRPAFVRADVPTRTPRPGRRQIANTSRPGNERLGREEVAHLVAWAASGEGEAWTHLVGEFSGMVRAIARTHRLGEADISDVLQVTWLHLFEHLDRISEPDRIGAWLATTARRECLRILRGTQRHTLVGDDMPETPSPHPPAHAALIEAERDVVLWQCFTQLPGRDQALLQLLLAEPKLGYDEIAAALDMPIGSIGPTRARALERLRQELEREGALALVLAE